MRSTRNMVLSDILFVAVALATASALIWVQLPSCPTWVVTSVVSVNLVGGVVRYLYLRSDRVRFAVQRARMWMLNEDVNWSMSIELLTDQKDILQTVYDSVRKSHPKSKTWDDGHNQKILELPGYVLRMRAIQIITDSDGLEACLVLQLSNGDRAFRASDRRLTEVNTLLSGLLSRGLAGQEPKITFEVNWRGSNPYFGLWVQRLSIRESDLISFRCDFRDYAGTEEGTVQVSQKRLQITTQDLGTWFELARRYVTLTAEVPGAAATIGTAS